jgi:hypothetical protein
VKPLRRQSTKVYCYCYVGARRSVVVEALRYKREGRGIESRWGGFFNLPNPSSRTLALGSTQPLTEMSTRNILEMFSGVKSDQCVGLTTLPPSVSQLSRENVGTSTSHNPMGLHGPLQGYLYFFLFTLHTWDFCYIPQTSSCHSIFCMIIPQSAIHWHYF